MNIDKNKRVFVIDFDNHLYDLLKDEYEIVKHSNYMKDFLDYDYSYDYLVADMMYKDGDIFELVKKTKVKPIVIEQFSNFMMSKLKNKVVFLSKDDFFIKENYIDISLDLKGYTLSLKAVEVLNKDNTLLGSIGDLYSLIGSEPSTVEKLIRYYKEALYDNKVLEFKHAELNKKYPTNSEFLASLLDLYNQKKIKVD